ncbi:uncharacterized protein F4822DRAFT_355523 [Hypoxylon trugodes]|uniref:uncharacterized protein n=1 Tax=Hypoxylon trugodes TaxID=326681 RepID=UPI00219DBC7D|nr:uncharacterized protein F4822DRAFT_355523 [Hypoxylon trugodes]KAI1385822.1 hypothetical protein F4822DRAFT_355523 [Hypoxylon trugodes]
MDSQAELPNPNMEAGGSTVPSPVAIPPRLFFVTVIDFSVPPGRVNHYIVRDLPIRRDLVLDPHTDEQTFRRAGEFYYTRQYTVPTVNPAAGPTATANNNDEDDAARRVSFAMDFGGFHRIIDCIRKVSQSEEVGAQQRERASSLLNRLEGNLSPDPQPIAVNQEVLFAHAKVYVFSIWGCVEPLKEYSSKMLLRALLQGDLTFEFADAFAAVVMFLFQNTPRSDGIRRPLAEITHKMTLVGAPSSHTQFTRLFNEIMLNHSI